MVAEVVHGAPCRFSDLARFFAGPWGKDRHPFPVPLRVYDETIRVMKTAVGKASWAARRNSARSSALTTKPPPRAKPNVASSF